MILLVPFQAAYAYRSAQIVADQAEVKDSPNGNTQANLPRGTRVNTSDMPTDGSYRVRSTSLSGWVQEGDLEFFGNYRPQPQPQYQRIERMEDPRGEDRDPDRYSQPSGSSHPWALKFFGGFDLWSPTSLDNVIGSTALQSGAGFGGELDFGLSRHFYLGIRVEDLSKSASGPDSTGQNTFQFNFSSVPVMFGIMFEALGGSNFSWDFGLYGGAGLSTTVTATETSAAAPNVTTVSATAPTFLVDTNINWHITDPFWFYLEIGYRYLQTSNLTPAATGAAGQGIFETTTNGVASFVPFNINLSGPVINLGARFNF